MSQCAFAESDACNKECCHFLSGSDLFSATEKMPLDGGKKCEAHDCLQRDFLLVFTCIEHEGHRENHYVNPILKRFG